MSTPAGPILGPCSSWIDGADVRGCCSITATDPDTDTALDALAVEASMALFEISGRQFSGSCERTVRPCRSGCSCFGPSRSAGQTVVTWEAGLALGWWIDECGDRCGCGSTSTVRLAGYPVTEIVEVRIDGEVVDPSTYRLDGRRMLVRLADPGPPVRGRSWPACQNLALDADQPGTFEVRYLWGVAPPQLGRDAAAALACQLYKACASGTGECELPAGTTKVTRQGVTVERGLLLDWLDPKKPTGIVAIDVFLAAYARNSAVRRPAIFSPDVQRFPRAVG